MQFFLLSELRTSETLKSEKKSFSQHSAVYISLKNIYLNGIYVYQVYVCIDTHIFKM